MAFGVAGVRVRHVTLFGVQGGEAAGRAAWGRGRERPALASMGPRNGISDVFLDKLGLANYIT